ncbi:MAG TPA: beta-ketoacyl-ACP synthase III [Spirochaetota bacterium]|nr:beta-ketoacyl-ACP synthase III [Spirochaetota bacterium]
MPVPNIMIKSTGAYVPEKVLTNADLEKIVDTTDEWITTRTGIRTRRIARDDEATSDLAYEASKVALKNAGLSPEEIELIIVATITPDMFFPSTACIVQDKLGAKNATAMDVNAACSGYIYALVVGSIFLQTGDFKNALIIGAEKLTAITDWNDRNTCVLFGDGAGAAVITPSDGRGKLLAYDLGSDGSFGDMLYIPGGGSRHPATQETVEQGLHYIKMNGNPLFKIAVNKMRETFERSLKKAGLKPDDISLIITHQANLRIIEALRSFLKVPKEKVFVNIEKYGNTSSASIGIALHEACDNNMIKRGDIVGLAAFGGGLTWGSAIIEF